MIAQILGNITIYFDFIVDISGPGDIAKMIFIFMSIPMDHERLLQL